MKEIIIELLNKLNNEDGATYLVGGSVIHYLLNRETNDLDFATTLNNEVLINLFPDAIIGDFGSLKVEYLGYHIDITHLRRDLLIDKGYPKYELTNDIKLDSLRRDFTINAIYLNKDLEFIDYVSGLNDFDNKIIDVIGDINIISDDPIRILRAIRFMITYDFKLSDNLENYIKNNINLINNIKEHKLLKEIDKIKHLDYLKYNDYLINLGLDLSKY